jgi:hypothetical protein
MFKRTRLSSVSQLRKKHTYLPFGDIRRLRNADLQRTGGKLAQDQHGIVGRGGLASLFDAFLP